jgi:environmental stress-induced protein Ves
MLGVWRAGDHRQTEWRNGGGITWEVMSRPPSAGLDDFDWRISFAEVAAGGPFSTFAGVDRAIVLVDGPQMRLTVDGVVHELQRYRPFLFDGAATTECDVPAGPTRDLNVMVRRGRCRATTDVVHLSGTAPVAVHGGDPVVLLLTLAGALAVVTPDGSCTHLEKLDALSWAGRTPAVVVSGTGTAAVVRLTPEE